MSLTNDLELLESAIVRAPTSLATSREPFFYLVHPLSRPLNSDASFPGGLLRYATAGGLSGKSRSPICFGKSSRVAVGGRSGLMVKQRGCLIAKI